MRTGVKEAPAIFAGRGLHFARIGATRVTSRSASGLYSPGKRHLSWRSLTWRLTNRPSRNARLSESTSSIKSPTRRFVRLSQSWEAWLISEASCRDRVRHRHRQSFRNRRRSACQSVRSSYPMPAVSAACTHSTTQPEKSTIMAWLTAQTRQMKIPQHGSERRTRT